MASLSTSLPRVSTGFPDLLAVTPAPATELAPRPSNQAMLLSLESQTNFLAESPMTKVRTKRKNLQTIQRLKQWMDTIESYIRAFLYDMYAYTHFKFSACLVHEMAAQSHQLKNSIPLQPRIPYLKSLTLDSSLKPLKTGTQHLRPLPLCSHRRCCPHRGPWPIDMVFTWAMCQHEHNPPQHRWRMFFVTISSDGHTMSDSRIWGPPFVPHVPIL